MKSIATFFRLLHAGFVLARHDALVPEEYARNVPWYIRFVGWVSRLFARKGRAKNPGERFANALEKLGPAYIKLGQVLSTRSDILDPEFARGLGRLKDQVPSFPKDQALTRIDAELGHSWQKTFRSVSASVAAASVAQVHKGVLQDGTEVAIKILRPDIRKAMARDMDVLAMVAGLTNRFLKDADRLRPRQFVETVKRAVTLELDLRLEAAAASELAEAAKETGLFKVPEIYWALSGKNVMVMQWMDGISLSSDEVLSDPAIDRKALARTVIQSFLTCAFDYGVFHADMHEGNLIVDQTGQLILLDFGILGRLSAAEQRFHAEILYGFLKRDYHRIAEIHFEAGYVPAHHTVEDFASALRAVGEPIFGKTSDEVSMSKVLLQLFEITDIFDMKMQPQLIMLQKTMMQAEGVARRLDPEFDMWAAARPVVETTMRRELGPEGRLDDFLDDLRAAQKTLKALPGAADNLAALAQAWADGEVDLSPKGNDETLTKTRGLIKPVVWTAFGVIIAFGGIWVAGQF
ncbi:MAG TPA: 2-polyprenylphenol 6-hydroxylase [Hellea balneolensis]|uniref:2-polyprenylphenol 6-hydroxylase n=1 Tax=Hellea balneolensis TaxID=287478 RepID=A0A7C5LUN4_9PROT|nr:2-polyprenylphenol 6-hydroxylase [Hellea balneolensis]